MQVGAFIFWIGKEAQIASDSLPVNLFSILNAVNGIFVN